MNNLQEARGLSREKSGGKEGREGGRERGEK